MLPQKHFDKIEKGAIDQINPSTKPAKVENPPKKVVEIKENALDKKVSADDDEYEYDYNYDDDIDNNDDIVNVTPKTAPNKMRAYQLDFKFLPIEAAHSHAISHLNNGFIFIHSSTDKSK